MRRKDIKSRKILVISPQQKNMIGVGTQTLEIDYVREIEQ